MRLLKIVATAAIALAMTANTVQLTGHTATAKAATFSDLNGTWRGGGKLKLASGRSERLRCRAYYTPKEGGKRLGMAVRCASTSYKFELRAQLTVKGSRVSGSWEERNFNSSGRVNGSLRRGRMALSARGSLRAGLFVTYNRNRQTVRMTGKFDNFRGMSLSFRR